jgi:hypothetical protein
MYRIRGHRRVLLNSKCNKAVSYPFRIRKRTGKPWYLNSYYCLSRYVVLLYMLLSCSLLSLHDLQDSSAT